MSAFDLEDRQVVSEAAGKWWIFLLTGISWLLVSIIILRFDYRSVSAVSLLFGFVACFAGANEFLAMVMAQRWWKVVHGALGLIFVVIGIVAFVHPGNTFTALAAVFSFFLIFKGAFDIILSIATRQEIEFWWLQLVVGIAEIAIGFWAAGYFGHSVILLVAWVGASALLRAITEIVFAFKLRTAGKLLSAT